MSHLILASQSPRRRELLAAAGFEFTVRARPVDENRRSGESPVDYVRRLATEKAEASWESEDEIVLGADTTVVVDEHVLEKPTDAEDARRMLTLLSGREHSVITGICLRHAGGTVVDHAVTIVRFSALSLRETDAYVRSGEPMDKAGAYAIQGLASKFVESIEGCYFNVVGLPVSLVYRRLSELREQPE
jgi:nucleoside triphosphate pyrophosphatase